MIISDIIISYIKESKKNGGTDRRETDLCNVQKNGNQQVFHRGTVENLKKRWKSPDGNPSFRVFAVQNKGCKG